MSTNEFWRSDDTTEKQINAIINLRRALHCTKCWKIDTKGDAHDVIQHMLNCLKHKDSPTMRVCPGRVIEDKFSIDADVLDTY